MSTERIEAVLLDIDGTLVDSNAAHACAWVDALAEAGHRVPYEKVRRLIGKGGDKVLPELTGFSKDSPQGKKISDRRTALFKEKYLPELRAFPKAGELLERFHDDGFKLVAATSAQEDEMNALLEISGGAEFFEKTASSADAPQSKPDPDIVEAALGKVHCPPKRAVMLGDTPYDVEAATRADVRVVAFRSGGWPEAGLTGAIAIYDDAADLLAHYQRSIFAR
jgi:phosphoglycolate phosphatase-like HAD superfamily hydrolase